MNFDRSKSGALARAWAMVFMGMLLALLLPGVVHAQAIQSDCRLANPNSSGAHVAEICWFQFGSVNQDLAGGTPGTSRDYDVALPDGSRITYTARITGGTHANPGLRVLQAPAWTGSHFSGTSGYYTILTPNAAALNTPENGRGNGVVLTLEDVRLFAPDGREINDLPFQIIMADAERLNSNPEHMDFGVVSGGQPWVVMEWLGDSASNNVSRSTPPASSACLSTYVDCARFTGTSNGNANTVVLAANRDPNSPAPFTVMAQIHSNAGQGFAIGVRWGSVRLRKMLPEGRIAPQDQFAYRISNAVGTEVATGTTTAATTTSPWISAMAMPGNRLVLEEVMAPGSSSVLGQYSRWVTCQVVGGPILIDQAYNPANPPQIVIDSGQPGDNIDCEITNRPAQFDLTVAKTVSQINGQPAASGVAVSPGDVVTYQIEVTNISNTETAIVPVGAVVEGIPANTEVVAAGNDFTCYLNSCSNTAELTINPGSSVILDFVVRVDDPLADGVTEIVNQVAVDGVDCAAAGNSCSEILPIAPSVTVAKSADPASGVPVLPGAQVSYTLTVTVANAPTTSAVVLSDTLGAGLTFDSVSSPGGFSHNGANAPIHVFTLPAGAAVGSHSVTYVATVDADAGNTVGNSVTGEGGGGPDPVCVDCTTEHPVHRPSLELTKTGTLSADESTITYVFSVENTGNVALTNVSVSDPLLPALDCPVIATLAPGATQTLTCTDNVYTVRPGDVDAGQVENTATASGQPPTPPGGPAPDPVTDDDTETTPLAQDAGLEVAKSVTSAGPYTEGDVITYQFVVTNTGNVTLTGVSVTDPLPGLSAITYAWPGADGVLDAGQSVTATATYVVTAADVNTGNVHNSAIAGGTPPSTPSNPNPPPVDSPPDEEDTPITQDPSLEVTKSVTSTGPYTEGDTITYQFVVTNTGDVTLTGVSVTDPLPGLSAITYAWPGAAGVLDVGQSVTATATYVVTAADVNSGNVHNSAIAGGTPPSTPSNPNPPPIDSPPDEEDTPITQEPGLSLVKSAASAGPYAEGDTITYQFVVTNTGDVTLTNVSVTDPLPGLSAITYAWPGADGVLDAGQSATATATYVVTAADVNAGNVHNSATADGTPPSTPTNPTPPPVTTPPSPVDTPIAQDPSLSLVKSVTSTGPYTVGDTISYQFLVENTGDVTLTGVSVTDELPGLGTISYAWPGADGVLDAGQSATATATYVVTAADVNAGSVHNSATADGTPPSTPTNPTPPPVTTPPSPVDTPIAQDPSLSLVKSVTSAGPYTEGDTISYQFVVTNTGDVTLTNVSVTDPLPGLSAITYAWPGAAGVLDAGQSVTATATYVVTAADVNAGNVHNSAIAGGTPPSTPSNPNPPPVDSPPDEEDTPITQEPGLELIKSVTSAGPYTEDDTIIYQFVVTNTGDVTLTNVSVTDPLPGLSAITYAWPGVAGVLDAGQSVTATATYVVTAADVNAGNVHNSAIAGGTPPSTPSNPNPPPVDSPPDEEDTPITQDPSLELTKSVTSTGPYAEGDTISYQFVVTNTGDVTLTNVSVTDPLPGLSAITYAWPGAAGVLDAGQSVTATATYVVTAADVNAGNVHNSAIAGGTPPSTPSNPNPPPVDSPPDEEDTPIAQEPGLEFSKSVTSTGPYTEGDTITYQFVVTNTGDVTLTGVSVTDPLPGLSAITYAWPGADGVLDAGQSVTATATYTVTAADVNAGNVHNSAIAGGTPPSTPSNPNPPPIDSPPDEEDTPITQDPSLELTKSVTSTGPYTEGDTISYQFLVVNTGDVTLTNVSVTDALVGLSAISYAWPGAEGVLLVGESVTATATYVVTAADVNAGNVHNSATADGTPPSTPSNPTPPPVTTPPSPV
ncbi:beta strand repeat-containing protein, partial [Luteimonas sp. A537]